MNGWQIRRFRTAPRRSWKQRRGSLNISADGVPRTWETAAEIAARGVARHGDAPFHRRYFDGILPTVCDILLQRISLLSLRREA